HTANPLQPFNNVITPHSPRRALLTMQTAVIFCETSNPTKWVIDQPPTVLITGQRSGRGTIDKSST
ncbi:MAG: hypothetical protein WBV25_16310, partial [Methylocella sp.]